MISGGGGSHGGGPGLFLRYFAVSCSVLLCCVRFTSLSVGGIASDDIGIIREARWTRAKETKVMNLLMALHENWKDFFKETARIPFPECSC